MPKRIQRKRAKGWRMPPNTVYVGRPTMFQNPYKLADFVSREACIAMFRKQALLPEGGYIYRERVVKHLRGKDLACFCPLDQPCHADVLLEIANEQQ
jgi:hypothetical protein